MKILIGDERIWYPFRFIDSIRSRVGILQQGWTLITAELYNLTQNQNA